MSIEAESKEHQTELETDNEQKIAILKAILAGIALIADVSPEDLIELAKGL